MGKVKDLLIDQDNKPVRNTGRWTFLEADKLKKHEYNQRYYKRHPEKFITDEKITCPYCNRTMKKLYFDKTHLKRSRKCQSLRNAM